jgi:hypothetical protein
VNRFRRSGVTTWSIGCVARATSSKSPIVTKAIMKISKDKQNFGKNMDVAYPTLSKDNELLLPFPELPRLTKPKNDEAAN